MALRCEDLPDAGVVLVPHDSPNFATLVAEITRHIESPPHGGPPPRPGGKVELPDPDDAASAILWNKSGKPICAYTLVWEPGGTYILGVGSMPSLLLPFGLTDEQRAFVSYWQTILPDSKRWLGQGNVLGSNADIRPPAGDEVWHGGVMRWGGGNARRGPEPDTVTLTIDAVFFATGECAGHDIHQLWDQVVSPAEVAQMVARAARQGVESGLSADRILANIEQITGTARGAPPAPPPPFGSGDPHEFREYARQKFANQIANMRKAGGDEKTVATLNSWADARVPAFRRI